MEPTMNITRADLYVRRHRPSSTLPAIRPGQVPQALFVTEVIAAGLTHVANDSFTGRADPDGLLKLGTPIMIRADRAHDEVDALLRLPGGEVLLLDAGHGQVWIDVGAPTRTAAASAVNRLRESLSSEPPPPERVSIAFWMRGESGGDVRYREIDAPRFSEIEGNYPAAVHEQLVRLLDSRTPARGRLILWRGPPGTGKSHALRALARAWAPWCSAHFIMDPEELLGRGGAYMLDVLSWDGDDQDRWRLVILEDAGELIAADARSLAGQALSRLLNVADGLLGQGTNTLLLITTNESLGRLHPAARRPGRCLADIEFVPFAPAEARRWLKDHGSEREAASEMTLAELFNETDEPRQLAAAEVPRFGFARALDDDCS
jgi:hypothetical protein